METTSRRREVQSVRKALRVMECVLAHPKGLSLADISQLTELNKNTVFQLLNTLCACGYLFQDKQSKDYLPGSRLIWLFNPNDFYVNMVSQSRPILTQLAAKTGETAHIAIIDGTEVRFLEKAESPQSLCVVTDLDVPIAVQCTSVGKAMMARMPQERLEEILGAIVYETHTETTVRNEAELRRELQFVRENGYAIDNEEHFVGVRCVASPILDATGAPICAIGISAPKMRMADFEQFSGDVIDAANALQRQISG